MQRAYFTALGLVGSHEEALDLSQEAFVRAYRNLKSFDPSRRFFTWYYQILKNLCANFRRDRTRHALPFSQIQEGVLENLPDASADTGRLAEQNEIRQLVWQALADLPEASREIILLRDFQGLSYQEIAELLDCPLGTVMSRLYHARRALQGRLEGLWP